MKIGVGKYGKCKTWPPSIENLGYRNSFMPKIENSWLENSIFAFADIENPGFEISIFVLANIENSRFGLPSI